MRILRLTAIIASPVVAVLLSVASAYGFTVSEEERLQIDLREARARATDFRAHVRRLELLERERERHAQESKRLREAEETRQERARQIYVVERNRKVSDDQIRARLEDEWNRDQERQAAAMDRARIDYLRKRKTVQEIIDREASIDENIEYDLTP